MIRQSIGVLSGPSGRMSPRCEITLSRSYTQLVAH